MAKSDLKQRSDDDKIVAEAKKRFKRCQSYEATFRKRYQEDVKFANGDARNMYQWPSEARTNREGENKPCFTFNKTRVHCLQIINDARQNKQAIKVTPTGGGASYDSAQVYSGLVRHIEYQSNAQNVYTTSVRTQVQGGVGYWRVVTDYANDDSFDQDIFIRRVKDPMSVYLDPDCNEADRSDARFGFIFDSVPTEEAEADYPELKDRGRDESLGEDYVWHDEDHTRIAEYFRRVKVDDELVAVDITDENGQPQRIVRRLSELQDDDRLSMVPFKDMKAYLQSLGARFRPAPTMKVEWYKMAGDLIVDRRDWPGQYIPIVMLIGEETVINGEMDRKGHVRALIDAQMNFNYWVSEAATQVALQNKIPYVGDARAFEGYETYWNNANKTNYNYLPYNGVDDEGNQIAAPSRQQPPAIAQAYLAGMQFSEEQMRMVTGQYQASIGAPGNETSGVAIQQRQRQADNATYHYVDHLANAIRFTGRIIIDLVPKVYDTPRVMKIMADDGKVTEVMLDPAAEQAYQKHEQEEEMKVKAIFNPNVGKYEVEADVGPSFATQRQEAFNALSQIISQSPDLMKIAGDLLMKAADFPLADEMAERLKRMVPPQALGQGPTTNEQALQQQLQAMQQLVSALSEKIEQQKRDLEDKAGDLTVDAYDAETKRISALKDALPVDAEGLMALVRQTVLDALQTPPPDQSAPQQADLPQPPPGGFLVPEEEQAQ